MKLEKRTALKKNFIAFLGIFLMFICLGCPSETSPVEPQQIKVHRVTGIVNVPPSEQITFLTYNIFNLITGSPAYALNGLVPVKEDTEIRLIRIDDNGTQIGDALATTKTDGEGKYTLTVDITRATLPASDLVLEVKNRNGDKRVIVKVMT